MSPNMITVKYIGKCDAMTVDYNHKRYVFRAKQRVSTIPSDVYDYVKKQKDMLSYDIVPWQEQVAPVVEVKQEVRESVKTKKAKSEK